MTKRAPPGALFRVTPAAFVSSGRTSEPAAPPARISMRLASVAAIALRHQVRHTRPLVVAMFAAVLRGERRNTKRPALRLSMDAERVGQGVVDLSHQVGRKDAHEPPQAILVYREQLIALDP